MLQVRDQAAVPRQAAEIYTRDASAARHIVDQIRVRITNGADPTDLRQVYKRAIRLSVSPILAHAKNGAITTNSVTVSVTGGTAPFTYSWVMLSGAPIVPTAPTAATTAFYYTGGLDLAGTARCTVTDSTGLSNFIDEPVSFTTAAGGGTQ